MKYLLDLNAVIGLLAGKPEPSGRHSRWPELRSDPYDVLIAGQAQARDLILITHNVGEFSRVDGLRFEDWEG